MEPTLDPVDYKSEEQPVTTAPHDTVQPETELTTEELEDMLVRDFYLSFRFSQGNIGNQGDILAAVIDYYSRKRNVPATSIRDVIASEEFKLKIERIIPPNRHRITRKDTKVDSLKKAYLSFKKEVDDTVIRTYQLDDHSYTSLVESHMVISDLDYQDKPRPRPQNDKSDQHGSLYREFVILGRPTGSECYDNIFTTMRARTLRLLREHKEHSHSHDDYRHNQLSGILMLTSAWERNHPGEKFVPDELLETS